MTFTTLLFIVMPDGSTSEIEVEVTATRERNPAGKEPEQYLGEEDGWIVTEITLA